MVAKASPVPAGSSAQGRMQTSDRIHRAAAVRTQPERDARCSMLATMRAAARRCHAARAAEVKPRKAKPRKAKRAKQARSLGGRLAAAIRMARLRAHRAAEEHRGAKR